MSPLGFFFAMERLMSLTLRKLAQRVPSTLNPGRCYSRYEAEDFMRRDVRRRDVLAKNPNKTTALLDGADYTFSDGRPTPYGARAVRRMEKQQKYTEQIIKHTREMDMARATHKRVVMEKEQEVQDILNSKLKEKGRKLLE